MRVRFRESGSVVTADEFRSIFRDTSFPPGEPSAETLDVFNCDYVHEGPQPEITENQFVKYDGVVQENGQWLTKYIAADYSEADIAAYLSDWRKAASCTPFQGRVALSNAGMLAQAQMAVDAADEKTKLAWEYATSWDRMSPMILSLSSALGLSETQVDDLFKQAAKITA